MPVMGHKQKAKLSLDAAHLVNRMEANRDHLVMSGATVAAGLTYAGYAIQNDLGVAATSASVLLAVSAGYSAIKLCQHLFSQDRKIETLAEQTGQQPPQRNALGLMELGASQNVVAGADAVRPDLVSAVADRRARRWEAALATDYRPPQRTPRQGG